MGVRRVKPQWRIIKAVEFVDFEAGSANRRGGVAIRMTPATQAGLQRCYRILQECKPWLARPDVLEKAKLPGRFQRPTDFAECGAGVGDRTQHQRGHRSVECVVLHRQRGGVTGNHSHPHRRVRSGSFGQAPQVAFRFNRHYLGDRIGVVAEVHTVARADLDHPPGQAGQHPVRYVAVPGAPIRRSSARTCGQTVGVETATNPPCRLLCFRRLLTSTSEAVGVAGRITALQPRLVHPQPAELLAVREEAGVGHQTASGDVSVELGHPRADALG
ncbi:hypothetical protein I553_3839 [Mycobacterium xenopi 4042]|uniref:Uncharacterized protein n=1 Tax=Mycobacterium xenopi 4042 TaxID=1299334 RepID=X7YUQ1_MYCXE|nr:hypothetical protein I553_3839 [Mycobacterium xenopi 4042]